MSQNYSNAGVNLSDIEEMLQNINSYGLSHLCAFSVFESAEVSIGDFVRWTNHPFLDIYYKNDRANRRLDVEFYSRGNKYYKTSFNNLLEYHIFNEQSGFEEDF